MIWSCQNCGTILQLWKMKCPNCSKSGVSWLQPLVIGVVVVPALFFVVKMI